jgi:hypothetical protein
VLAACDLWLWLDARLVDLPAWVRLALGGRIADTAIDLLACLTDATWLPTDGWKRGGAPPRNAVTGRASLSTSRPGSSSHARAGCATHPGSRAVIPPRRTCAPVPARAERVVDQGA